MGRGMPAAPATASLALKVASGELSTLTCTALRPVRKAEREGEQNRKA
jgi:hypothetical protein